MTIWIVFISLVNCRNLIPLIGNLVVIGVYNSATGRSNRFFKSHLNLVSIFCIYFFGLRAFNFPNLHTLRLLEYSKKPSRNEGFYRGRTPDTIRTCDPQLRRLLLYPTELPGQFYLINNILIYTIQSAYFPRRIGK